MHIQGIKTENNSHGEVKYLRIDLDMYGDDEFLEDFLDNLAVKNRKDEKSIPFEDVIKAENKRRGLVNV
ncbi:hypothetical protein Barb6_02571 [Bacteroidales bacterium Barb6]|nr:hypothetical protein Barb6_02571 [Bacteroidales bacterium Barb6]